MWALFGLLLGIGVVLSSPLQAATGLLEIGELCSVAIDGVPLKQGEIIAEEATLRAFLQEGATVTMHSCNAMLAAGPGESEHDYVLTHETVEVAMSMPPGQVLVRRLVTADVLLLVAASSGVEASVATAPAMTPPAPPNTPPPPAPPPTVSPGPADQSDADRTCEFDAELCISKDGTVSASLSCGPIEVTVESDGEDSGVSIGVTAVSLHIGGH